jgi:hypothetical protein
MAEIRAALAVGKEVVTHTAAVSVPGWTGAGYVILDPQSGVGAWKIGGGENGAYLIVSGMALIALAISIGFVALAGAPLAATLAASLGFLGVEGFLVVAGASLIMAGLALVSGDLRACSNWLELGTGAMSILLSTIFPMLALPVSSVILGVLLNDGSGQVCR